MNQASSDAMEQLVEKDTWTAEDARQLRRQLSRSKDAPRRLRTLLSQMEADNPDPSGAPALKIGIARFMLCRFAEALNALSAATDNKDRRYFQGLCLKHLGEYDQAVEELQRATDRGWEGPETQFEVVACKALGGDTDAAGKELDKLAGKHGDSADFVYLQGLIAELSGDGDAAEKAYLKAREIDEDHSAATFRLAYYYDLHGDEDEALELYREVVSSPPVHANALLNMSVLYEDAGKYDMAIACLQRILATNPGHARARLFLKDAEASKTMYYDEDQARRIARRNAVLDIPISDFELSVRARNCLKKMNIRTLGDLVRTTEAELLAYKNFGETSLKEIKEMLSAKGLRLGQALEEEGGEFAGSLISSGPDNGLLATPIDQIDFSVRARKALDTLGVRVLGDLTSKTEAELLACKNFGQTSLNEVRQRLNEHGLRLREPS